MSRESCPQAQRGCGSISSSTVLPCSSSSSILRLSSSSLGPSRFARQVGRATRKCWSSSAFLPQRWPISGGSGLWNGERLSEQNQNENLQLMMVIAIRHLHLELIIPNHLERSASCIGRSRNLLILIITRS